MLSLATSCVAIYGKLTKDDGFKVLIASCVVLSGKLTKDGGLTKVIASCVAISGKLTRDGGLIVVIHKSSQSRKILFPQTPPNSSVAQGVSISNWASSVTIPHEVKSTHPAQ